MNDRTATQPELLTERTPALEALRVGLYSLCQFHLNGALDAPQIEPMFRELVKSFYTGLAQEGARPQLRLRAAGTAPTAALASSTAASAAAVGKP
jgi:hypothetical protein